MSMEGDDHYVRYRVKGSILLRRNNAEIMMDPDELSLNTVSLHMGVEQTHF